MVGEVVRLDQRHLIDCTLIDCTLEYSGCEFILERTTLTRCQHVLDGAAFLTVRYLRTVGFMPDVELTTLAGLSAEVH